MTRAVVSIATTRYYQRGQARLINAMLDLGDADMFAVSGELPPGCPPHSEIPYAFKAFALRDAARRANLLLWCDACIVPVRPLAPLWERIKRDGYWMARNGWTNYEWTADSAYSDLFHGNSFHDALTFAMARQICADLRTARLSGRVETSDSRQAVVETTEETWRSMNRRIPHVVATAFGINTSHPNGKAFLAEYFRLASKTRAFCGPWRNLNYPDNADVNRAQWGNRLAACGPPDVRGHRHDQTAASVIAWRLGFDLTAPPDIFAYGRLGDPTHKNTILLADGSYV